MTIIGATRGFGRWIAEHLNNDFNITITSPNKDRGLEVAKELNVKYIQDNIEAVQCRYYYFQCTYNHHG